MARDIDLSLLVGRTNKNPGSLEQRAADVARRRRMAQALQEQALKQDEGLGGEMVSGYYIANPWKSLGKIATSAMAGYDLNKLNDEEKALATEREAAFKSGLANMPKDQAAIPQMPMGPGAPVEMGGGEGTVEGPAPMQPGQAARAASPQDWMNWGGEMSQTGPMGQQIGQTAITQGLGSIFKPPTLPNFEKIELDAGEGKKQLAYIDKRDPTKPPIPVGQPFKSEKKPSATQEREQLAAELVSLENTPQRTPAQEQRRQTLVTTLKDFIVTPTGDGGVLTGNRAGLAAGANPAPSVPGAPQPAPAPSVNGQPGLGKVDPLVQADRDRKALELKVAERAQFPEGTPERDALEKDIAQTEASVRQNQASADKSTPGADPYAQYRDDPRNAPYIPKGTPAGMTKSVASTGSQNALNADVAKLSDTLQKEGVPVLVAAWEQFEAAMKKARAEAKKPMGERSILEHMQFGRGVGGPLGIHNIVPAVLTSPAGRELKIATEAVKAFQRHKLFGATLTGNEKESFEILAGTGIGMEDAEFERAMNNMRQGLEADKANIYGRAAPIVVDEYKKSRNANRATLNGGSASTKQPYWTPPADAF